MRFIRCDESKDDSRCIRGGKNRLPVTTEMVRRELACAVASMEDPFPGCTNERTTQRGGESMGSSEQMEVTRNFTGGTAFMDAQFRIDALHLGAHRVD